MRSVIVLVSLIATLAALSAFERRDLASPMEIDFKEDFEKGADNWEPMDKEIWTIKKGDGGNVFSQHKKESKYKPAVRSPVNIALLKDRPVSDMELHAKVLSTHKDYGHRDAVLVFGYQDATHFYYVHLGKETDDHANQIFIVNGEARKKISTKTSKGTPWDEKWHNVKIVRRPSDGTIEVYFDDMKTPVMTATDKTFTHGRIGIGSFDDTTDWDDIRLFGVIPE